MTIIEPILVFVLGLMLGSFSTALAYRVPRKIDWVSQRSACTVCKSVLKGRDLIPVFSWVVFRGKCRSCGAKISPRYPLIELLCAGLCLAVYAVFGWSMEALFILAAIPFLLSLLFIDLALMILPNVLVFIVFFIGVVRLIFLLLTTPYYYANDILFSYGIGALGFAAVSWVIGWGTGVLLKREALGFGDIKFFLVAGLWLGIEALPYFLIASGGIGVVFAMIWKIIKKDRVFPFGPALIAAFYFMLLFQGGDLVQ